MDKVARELSRKEWADFQFRDGREEHPGSGILASSFLGRCNSHIVGGKESLSF